MQEVMDTWEGGICATKGALEPSKSHWYLLDFKWIPQSLRWDYRFNMNSLAFSLSATPVAKENSSNVLKLTKDASHWDSISPLTAAKTERSSTS
jgi:hypothetical protein